MVRDPATGERRFARVKVPPLLPRFVVMPDGERFVPLEQVIAAHLDQLFPGMEVESHVAFRVTRNADLTLEEEEADDLLAAVEMELRRRRFGRAVRLEIDADMSPTRSASCCVGSSTSTRTTSTCHAARSTSSGLWAVHEPRPARPEGRRRGPPRHPAPPGTERRRARRHLRRACADGDLLVHHPYDSFATSVEEFIRQAVGRPQGAGHQADPLPHLGRQPDRRRRSSGRPSGASRWRRSSS